MTVNVNAALPGVAEAGLNEVMAGPVGAVIGKLSEFEVPALGVITEIVAVVGEAICVASTVAVSCAALT